MGMMKENQEALIMIKFVMCLTRHPDMTREEFKDY